MSRVVDVESVAGTLAPYVALSKLYGRQQEIYRRDMGGETSDLIERLTPCRVIDSVVP
jgi:hypothetical protein